MFLALLLAVNFGAIEVLLVGIPESLGILAAGVVLTSAAVITRKLLGSAKRDAAGDEAAK